MSKKTDALFSHNEASQVAYGDCPKCTSPLHLKHVGKTSFIACTAYPACDYSQSLKKQELVTLKLIENSCCPECDSELAVKKGRYGMFIGCTNFPNCHFISTNQSKKKKAEYTPVSCPRCKGGQLLMKQNRFGKFFYACDQYPKCKHVLNDQPINKPCPQCNAAIMLVKRQGDNIYTCAEDACGHVVDETQ